MVAAQQELAIATRIPLEFVVPPNELPVTADGTIITLADQLFMYAFLKSQYGEIPTVTPAHLPERSTPDGDCNSFIKLFEAKTIHQLRERLLTTEVEQHRQTEQAATQATLDHAWTQIGGNRRLWEKTVTKHIETVRSTTTESTFATTLKLLELQNIGPRATLAILKDIQTRAFQWKDIKSGRRQRYLEKMDLATQPQPEMPDGVLVYYQNEQLKAQAAQAEKEAAQLATMTADLEQAITESLALGLSPAQVTAMIPTLAYVVTEHHRRATKVEPQKVYPETEAELNAYFGHHPTMADYDRDIYMTIDSKISPHGIAAMIGVTYDEYMNNMKYRDIRFAAYCMQTSYATSYPEFSHQSYVR